MAIEIEPLNSYPEFAPILSHWTYLEWYKKRSIDFKIIIKSYLAMAKNDNPPLSLIALRGTLPVGMASLKNDDLWERKDLGPWLSSLYVIPEFRGKGVGTSLVSSIIKKGYNLGFKRIYLYLGADNPQILENFYKKRGWLFLSDSVDNDGLGTKIFFKDL